jgi:hypothetical protein
MRPCAIALIVIFVLSCDGDDPTGLFIDVRTDHLAVDEFATVEVSATPAGSTAEVRTSRDARLTDDFESGVRVAEYPDLPQGRTTVRVELRAASGERVASRELSFELTETRGLVVVISRDCAEVTCPSATSPADATTCYAGRCVTPTCSPLDLGACGPTDCAADEDCAPRAGCDRARCFEGACLSFGCGSGPSDGGMDTSPPADTSIDGGDAGVIDPSLVAWYTFDVEPRVDDASGNEHLGTCDPGRTCPTFEPGRIGMAAHFDGADDIITVPYATDFDFADGFTICAWIRVDALDPPGVFVARAYDATSQYSYGLWHDVGGEAFFGTWDPGRDQQNWQIVDSAIDEGTWVHVAGVWNGAEKCLFIDGTPDCETTVATVFADNELTIGAGPTRGGTARYHFDGLVDDVRLYRRALSTAEIMALATR